MLASAWWQKARRLRQWVAAGPAQSPELDVRIEAVLVVVVIQLKKHHGPWQRRLIAEVGQPIGSPREVRSKIERRLALFGPRWRVPDPKAGNPNSATATNRPLLSVRDSRRAGMPALLAREVSPDVQFTTLTVRSTVVSATGAPNG